MRISRRAVCALILAAAAGIASADDGPKKLPGIPVGAVFRPGQDPRDFVVGQPVAAPRPPTAGLAGLPDPYREDDNWARMPPGRIWGGASGVAIDRDGKSVWFITRCDTPAWGCTEAKNSKLDPVLKFDAKGNLVKSFGAGLFKFPHGIWVDKDDNVWIADGKAGTGNPADVGNTVRKFSADGKLLMTLGKAGVVGTGDDPYVFRAATAVAVAPNGDIFVVDGHDSDGGPNRVIKYDAQGKFLLQFGRQGAGPTEFNPAHGLAFDKAGNLYVADRGNNAVKVFTQDGKLLHVYENFGIPSGIWIDKDDHIYVADTDFAEPKPAPDYDVAGIRIANAKDPGRLIADIPFGEDDTLEGVAVAGDGTVYGGFTHKPGAHRWIPAGPLKK